MPPPEMTPQNPTHPAQTICRTAFLIFDSWDQHVFLGARAPGRGSRRLLFQAGPASLDLEVAAPGHRSPARLTGCVRAGADEQPRCVRCRHAGRERVVLVDARGEFELDALRRGAYAITVDFADWTMTASLIRL